MATKVTASENAPALLPEQAMRRGRDRRTGRGQRGSWPIWDYSKHVVTAIGRPR